MKRLLMIIVCLSSALLCGVNSRAAGPEPTSGDALRAVPTFNCIGLYWTTPKGDSQTPPACSVHYRVVGTQDWHQGLDLWRDDRGVNHLPGQYRGSLVNLQPDTEYEIRLDVEGGSSATIKQKTWSENFPIGQTHELKTGASEDMLTIATSGSPTGYELYTHPKDNTSTIDVNNAHPHCIQIDASYVIVRGLILKGAGADAIFLGPNVHDVVIEDCDISGWGRVSPSGFGENYDSGVRGDGAAITRIIIQNNRIHDPRFGANSWDERNSNGDHGPHPDVWHPEGPQAVSFFDTAGNHVVRYNEFTTTLGHYFNDGFGGGSNFSYAGSPNKDSDIYGNLIRGCRDDAIESEGANCNVRIWENHLDHTLVGIAMASVSIGPIYVFRNIVGEVERSPIADSDDMKKGNGGFIKNADKVFDPTTKSYVQEGLGRIYVFHNTVLQPPPPPGKKIPVGPQQGLGWGGAMRNLWSRNNILQMRSEKGVALHGFDDPQCNHDYDLYTGLIQRSVSPVETHGIKAAPIYGGDWSKGEFFLAKDSPGLDAGVILPNFNDNFAGAAPDMGAQEAGTPPMQFGVRTEH